MYGLQLNLLQYTGRRVPSCFTGNAMPGMDGSQGMFHGMFGPSDLRDMFVHQSGLRRAQGTPNEALKPCFRHSTSDSSEHFTLVCFTICLFLQRLSLGVRQAVLSPSFLWQFPSAHRWNQMAELVPAPPPNNKPEQSPSPVRLTPHNDPLVSSSHAAHDLPPPHIRTPSRR